MSAIQALARMVDSALMKSISSHANAQQVRFCGTKGPDYMRKGGLIKRGGPGTRGRVLFAST